MSTMARLVRSLHFGWHTISSNALQSIIISRQRPHTYRNLTDTYLVLVLGQHLMGQVKQADDGVLGHTFPHERHGVPTPLHIK